MWVNRKEQIQSYPCNTFIVPYFFHTYKNQPSTTHHSFTPTIQTTHHHITYPPPNQPPPIPFSVPLTAPFKSNRYILHSILKKIRKNFTRFFAIFRTLSRFFATKNNQSCTLKSTHTHIPYFQQSPPFEPVSLDFPRNSGSFLFPYHTILHTFIINPSTYTPSSNIYQIIPEKLLQDTNIFLFIFCILKEFFIALARPIYFFPIGLTWLTATMKPS